MPVPQIRLNKLSEQTGCNILGKAEFQNPGGSVKDRAALWVVKNAEEQGASAGPREGRCSALRRPSSG